MKRSLVSSLVLVLALASAGVQRDAAASPIPMPPELWVMEADGFGQRALSSTAQERRPVVGHGWSPDGGQIAYLTVDTLRIHSLADGSDREIAIVEGASSVAWSPDGQWIAVGSYSGSPRGLFLVHPDGSDLHHVGPDAQAGTPAWSPDSSRLAATFFSDPGTIPFLATVALDGSHHVVTSEGGYGPPDWNPAGTEIAFIDHFGRLSIARADGSISKLTPPDSAFGKPDWSPTGSLIAYRSDRGLAVINPDGSGRAVLNGRAYQPDWDPSGSALAVVIEDDIYRLNSRPIQVVNLTDTVDRLDYAPLWSPDGTKIAYLSSLRTVPPDETIDRTVSLRQRRHLVLRGAVRDLGESPSSCNSTPTDVLIQRRKAGTWSTVRRVVADQDGRFRVKLADHPGRYRATVRKKEFFQPGSGHRVTCAAARSRAVPHRH